jgi:Uma2 family endonuclease
MEVAWYADEMLDPGELDPDRLRPLRRSEYERLVSAGVFEDERVELLRGQIVTMSPQGALHINATARIARLLIRQLGQEYQVLTHSGVAAWEDSMPEPDVAVVPDGAWNEHATTAFLIVEVADSSLRKDSRVKAALYAEAGISTYWIVDLRRRVVLVHTQPVDGRYTSIVACEPGAMLRVAEVPSVLIPVTDIVPPE